MGAIADLWKSERGLIAVLLVLGATVLTALSQMTIQDWQSYTIWIFGLYAGGKTITGAVDLLTGSKRDMAAGTAAEIPAPSVTAPTEPAPAASEPPK